QGTGAMKRSEQKILTTHTGSLPRTPALLALVAKNERGEAVDRAELNRVIRPAVQAVVKRQVECGLSVVNDREQGKTNFSSYHYHRLSGFQEVPAAPSTKLHACHAEAVDFPDFFRYRWMASGPGAGGEFKLPTAELCCTAAIGWKDFSEVER